MRPLSHEAGKLLVGQLLVMDSFLLFLCLLHNRNAGNAGISQIGCIGVREGAWRSHPSISSSTPNFTLICESVKV